MLSAFDLDQTLPGWAIDNGRPSLEMCSNKSRYNLLRPRSHSRRLLYDPRILDASALFKSLDFGKDGSSTRKRLKRNLGLAALHLQRT